jgi:hypothetical protein
MLDTRAKGCDVETTLVDIVHKDLGWKQEEDSRLKYRLLKEPYDQSVGEGRRLDCTFNDILQCHELQNFIRYNMQFRLIDWKILQ